jgi:hypothetical protein
MADEPIAKEYRRSLPQEETEEERRRLDTYLAIEQLAEIVRLLRKPLRTQTVPSDGAAFVSINVGDRPTLISPKYPNKLRVTITNRGANALWLGTNLSVRDGEGYRVLTDESVTIATRGDVAGICAAGLTTDADIIVESEL